MINIFNKKQVNLILKDHVLRYVVNNQPTLDGIIDAGELILEDEIIDDGKLINSKALQNILEPLVIRAGRISHFLSVFRIVLSPFANSLSRSN